MLWAYIIIAILVAAVVAVELWLEAFTAMGVTFYIVAIVAIVWAVWNLIRSFRRNNGRFAWNKWERAKLRFTGIAFIVIAIFVIALARFASALGATDDSIPSSTPEPTATAVAYGPEYGGVNGSELIDEAGEEDISAEDAIPAVPDLNQEEIDIMYSQYSRWLWRGSMPIMNKYKKVLTSFTRDGKQNEKLSYTDAVDLPLWAGLEGQPWFDDGLGIIRDQKATDNALPPEVFKKLNKETLEAMKKQAKEWLREDAEFIANAKSEFEVEEYVKTTVNAHILKNLVYADMWTQMFASEKVATLNNPWVFDVKKMFDDAYASEDGILSLTEYAPGHEGDTAWAQTKYDVFRRLTRICSLVDCLTGKGFVHLKSYERWCLLMGADARYTRTSLTKRTEKREAYMLGWDGKGGEPLLRIGVNSSDMSIMKFKLKTKITKKTQTDPPSTTSRPKTTPRSKKTPKPKKRITPTPKPSTTPTPTAKPTSTPTPTPTPTAKPTSTPTTKPTDPPKDKTKDPVNNGNADTGGGKNDSNDKAGPEKPKKTASPTRAPATTAKPIPTDTAVSGNPAGPGNGNITEGSQATNTNNKNDGVVTDDD